MHKGRILVVDDQEEILRSFEGILVDEGYEFIPARDGQEALHIVKSDSPEVVFLDIWIPGIDGMQTLRAIKRIDPGCSVIMMSGHGTIETAVKAIKLGATDYLEKPVNLDDVLHIVEKAVSNRPESEMPNGYNGGLPGGLTGNSELTGRLRRTIEEAAADSGSIWLMGNEGTGKEFVARIIHSLEGKDRSSLIKVRCSDLSDGNLDEIFLGKNDSPGRQREGKIAQAAGGTLLLLRVDRLAKSVMTRFARMIEGLVSGTPGMEVEPGFRGRIIATSIHDPSTLARDHAFPKDLVDALSHRVIRIPSLSERAEDIPLLVEHFLEEAVDEFDREISGVDGEAMARLVDYHWPGNVKELKILVEHVVMTAPGPSITLGDLLIPGDRELFSAPPENQARAEVGKTVPDATRAIELTLHDRNGSEVRAGSPAVSGEGRFRHQQTLRGRVVMYGQGLHSGVKTGLTLSPLPPGNGILFGHITSGGVVPALLNNVDSTEFSTCLRGDGSSARTIEHLMAVFHMYGLTNVLVKISGEVPIMDGSALEFCQLIEGAEIIPQEDLVEDIRITEPIELLFDAESGKKLRVEPSEHFEVDYFLDYPAPVGKMRMVYQCAGPEDFKENIAPARTFGFVKDVQMLDEMGLADGGRLSNLVLLDDEKVVNPPLRFPDEFVRHKILDIIGDFYLLGRPFRGKVIARQTGHSDNIAMLKMINERMNII